MELTAPRPLRIVHLVPNLNFGGLQELVRWLALGQVANGHTVSILCWDDRSSNHPEAAEVLEQGGVHVATARGGARGPVASLRTLRERLGSEPLDVLHIHNPFDYSLYGAVAGQLRRGTKVVNTLHATAMFERFSRKQKVKFWTSALLTNRFVSVCDETSDVLARRFRIPARKLAVIENGIDVARFLSIPPREQREEVVFGGVARMTKTKNQQLLIEAFARARNVHPAIRLRLLGSGAAEEPRLKALAATLELGESIEFCGYRDDVPGFLGEIDVFALPSRSEGLPLSLLEAIASGLPVVATDVGGVRKVVETTKSGRVCPSNDVEAFTEAMCATIVDPDRLQATERARENVVEHYSVARMTSDYERLYRSL